jgi:putative tryptophan/tyrosine transport system substrate-binding protein
VRRREFITLLGSAAAAFSTPAHSQNSPKHLIGNLASASQASSAPQYQAFINGLRDLGYVEGRDHEIVSRFANGVMERLPSLAEEIVRLKPDVIFSNPTPAVVAARALTTSIPIVSFMLADEMRLGLVASHAHPGGNVTGLLMRVDGMVGKQIELAIQTCVGATKIGILFNPSSADATNQRREAEAASALLGVQSVYEQVRSPDEIDTALRQLGNERVQVVAVLYDALFFQERRRIANLAATLRLPVVYAARDHVVDGGLISYGISLRANARRAAVYIDKIFKGAKPAELPVEFPTRLELVINTSGAGFQGPTGPN